MKKQFILTDVNYWIGSHDRLIEGLWTPSRIGLLVSPILGMDMTKIAVSCITLTNIIMWDDGPCDNKIHAICELRYVDLFILLPS
jgi:hypothetical protein